MALGVQSSPLLVQCIPEKGPRLPLCHRFGTLFISTCLFFPFFFFFSFSVYDGSMSCCCSMDSSLVNPGPLINSSGWADPALHCGWCPSSTHPVNARWKWDSWLISFSSDSETWRQPWTPPIGPTDEKNIREGGNRKGRHPPCVRLLFNDFPFFFLLLLNEKGGEKWK